MLDVCKKWAGSTKAWPFVEARRLHKRLLREGKTRAHFATGYGPSGLPHIGTFGEVLRTTLVRRALEYFAEVPSRLTCFSDDMDGLRKIPENIPHPEKLRPYLGRPLCCVPDPFGRYESFAAHNNARLRFFLERFGFDVDFVCASTCYRSGRFDVLLHRVLDSHAEVRAIVAPTLRAERRKTYSPFLPISPRSGRVLQSEIVELDRKSGSIVYREEDGSLEKVPVGGGCCKLQWKADWALRWTFFGIDYEMAGKDLRDSMRIGGRIARVLGGRAPEGFIYELFLDEHGEKISKSKGNGISVEEWLRYAPRESLGFFMYGKPRTAKRLHLDVIPHAMDVYLDHVRSFWREDPQERLSNPVWHIHGGSPPSVVPSIGYGMLLNLACASHSSRPEVLRRFVDRYSGGLSENRGSVLEGLLEKACNYYRDRIRPRRIRRPPTETEKHALRVVLERLQTLPHHASAEDVQQMLYGVGKEHVGISDLRSWFRSLYEVLLGQSGGPRLGSFFVFYGLEESRALIRRVLGEDIRSCGSDVPSVAE